MIEADHARTGNTMRSYGWALTAAVALAGIGLVAIHSVSGVYGADPNARLERQGLHIALAVVLGLGLVVIGHRRLIAWSPYLFIGNIALLCLLFVPGIPTVRGRWFDLGFASFQPSEAAKITMVLFLTRYAQKKGTDLGTLRHGFLPAMGLVATVAAIIMAEPDLGQGLFLLTLSSVVLLINGLRILHMAPVAIASLLAVKVMATCFPYVQGRIDAYLKGLSGGVDLTSQVGQGLVGLAAGGAMGRGVGDGRAHLSYVSEIHNDFVMVAVGEQGGVIASTLVVLLFALLTWHGLRIAYRARCRQSYSVAYAVTFMLGLQACVNFAVVTASAPAKGMSLPFVSYGGSAMLMVGAALGLLGSVARESARGAAEGGSYFLSVLSRSPLPADEDSELDALASLDDDHDDDSVFENEHVEEIEGISEPEPYLPSPNPRPAKTPLLSRRAMCP